MLGVSNYYDYEVYGDFAGLAAPSGIFPLFGLEIICLIDDLVKRGREDQRPRQPRQDVHLRQGHHALRADDRRGRAAAGHHPPQRQHAHARGRRKLAEVLRPARAADPA